MQMKLSSIMIAVLIFMAIFSGFDIFYEDLADKFGVSHTSLGDVYDSKELDDLAKQLQDEAKKGKSPTSQIIDIAYLSAVGTANVFINLPNILTAILNGTLGLIGIQFSIPAWFISLLLLSIAFLVTFAIISSVTRKDV